MYNLVARHSKTSIILVVFFILCGVLGQAKEASANITTAKTPDTTVTSSPSSTTTTVSTPLSTSSTNTTPSLPSGCNLSKSSDLEKTVLEKINDMKGEKYNINKIKAEFFSWVNFKMVLFLGTRWQTMNTYITFQYAQWLKTLLIRTLGLCK